MIRDIPEATAEFMQDFAIFEIFSEWLRIFEK
jgi:hypothetical protein